MSPSVGYIGEKCKNLLYLHFILTPTQIYHEFLFIKYKSPHSCFESSFSHPQPFASLASPLTGIHTAMLWRSWMSFSWSPESFTSCGWTAASSTIKDRWQRQQFLFYSGNLLWAGGVILTRTCTCLCLLPLLQIQSDSVGVRMKIKWISCYSWDINSAEYLSDLPV